MGVPRLSLLGSLLPQWHRLRCTMPIMRMRSLRGMVLRVLDRMLHQRGRSFLMAANMPVSCVLGG